MRNATRSRFFTLASSLGTCHQFTQTSQGLQLSTEAATFGSFSHSLLSAFRDDFPKLSILHFQFLAEPDPRSIDLDSSVGSKASSACFEVTLFSLQVKLRNALNDALCIVSAVELDTVDVPILPQSFWKSGRSYSTFQSSALVSAHVESVTLPMRFSSLCIFSCTVLRESSKQVETRYRGHVGGGEPTELEERYSIRAIERNPPR